MLLHYTGCSKVVCPNTLPFAAALSANSNVVYFRNRSPGTHSLTVFTSLTYVQLPRDPRRLLLTYYTVNPQYSATVY